MYQFLQDEQATAAVEYSLLIGLISLVIVGILHFLTGKLLDAFSLVSGGFSSVQVIEENGKSVLLEEL